MKRVVVIGAGGQGGPCVAILAKDKDVSEIVLADIDQDLLNKVKNRVKSDKLTCEKVDAGSLEEIERVTKGSEAVINLTLPRFNMNIMKAALKEGAHYVDTAFLDSVVPYKEQMLKHEPLTLDDEFKEAGLTALLGCGGLPGVDNVIVRYICDKLDQVDSICIRCGGKISEKPKDIISAWNPGWSPTTVIRDWSEDAVVFESGEYKMYPPFSGREDYNFAPYGTVSLCDHEHEETVSLARFIGKGVKYVAFKYAIDTQAGNLIKLGFASDEPIDVKGVKVLPLDVLLKLVPLPANNFFNEDETIKLPVDYVKMVAIEVKGTKSGENIEYTVSYPYTPHLVTIEERQELFNRFGTMCLFVALPAVIGAKMCVEGDAEKGVIATECLDPTKFMKRMSDVGAPVKFQETVSKEVVIA